MRLSLVLTSPLAKLVGLIYPSFCYLPGRVRIVQHARTGRIAAAKIIPIEVIKQSRMALDRIDEKTEKQRVGIEREILMMKLMDHPNIMRLYDVYSNEREMYVVAVIAPNLPSRCDLFAVLISLCCRLHLTLPFTES